MPHSGKKLLRRFCPKCVILVIPLPELFTIFSSKKKCFSAKKKKKFSEASIAFFISPTFLIHERYENYKQHRSKTKQLTYLSYPIPHKFNFSKTQQAQQAQQIHGVTPERLINSQCHPIASHIDTVKKFLILYAETLNRYPLPRVTPYYRINTRCHPIVSHKYTVSPHIITYLYGKKIFDIIC